MALAHPSAPRGHRRPRQRALEACVRGERGLRPDLSRTGAVVRCAALTSGEMRVAVRWTTCTRWTAAPGERCETGSARIAFRADRAEGDVMRRLPTPPGGRSWHMLGSGTVTCTRARHDLAGGEPGAVRRFEGTVDHLDGALWPVRGNDRVQTGISIVRGGGYTPVPGSSSRDQSACFPLRAEVQPRRAHPARVAAVRRRRWAGDAEQDGRPVAARAGAAGRRGAAQARGPRTRDHGVRGEGGLA